MTKGGGRHARPRFFGAHMTDELEIMQAADPMAKAREAKAKKAAEKAAAEAAQAQAQAASAGGEQPVVSSRRGRAEAPYEGEPVEMRVTPWGHGEISTGGDFGFERYAKGAITWCPEQSARQLYMKRWAEPVDPRYIDRWAEMERRELLANARRKARFDQVMEHGVGAGETYSADRD